MQQELTTAVPINPHDDGLRHHTGSRPDRIRHIAVFRKNNLAPQAPCHLVVVHTHGPANSHHRHHGGDADAYQPQRAFTGAHRTHELALAQMFTHRSVQNRRCAPAHGLAPYIARKFFGSLWRRKLHLAQSAAQLGSHQRGGCRPVVLQTQHMRCVRRCKTTDLHQPLAFKRCDCAVAAGRAGQAAQSLWLLLDLFQQFAFARIQLRRCRRLPGAKRQQHKTSVQGTAAFDVGQVGLEQLQHFGVTRPEQRHRHDALRPHCDLAVGTDMNFAVATQSDGAYIDRTHHGAPAAHFGALLCYLRSAVLQYAQVSGSAAHIGQDEVVQTRQPARAHQAGGRSGQHGFYRPGRHTLGQRQRTVALDDHQRAVDVQLLHGPVDGLDQRRYTRNQPCIEGRCQRAPGRIE